jgi:peroxiredoxin Q/BCP
MSPASSSPARAPLAAGDAAPPFDLPAAGGGRVSLQALAGQPVVVYFFPKADTPGCTKEALAFSALKPDFDQAGVTVVGISADPLARQDKFKAKHDLAVALGADESRDVAEAYGVWVEKSMYGKKSMGIERTTVLVGPDGHIARIWRKVKVEGHAEEVLAAAKAL